MHFPSRMRLFPVILAAALALSQKMYGQGVEDLAIAVSFNRPCGTVSTLQLPANWLCPPLTVSESPGSVVIERNGNSQVDAFTATLKSTLTTSGRGLLGSADFVDVQVYSTKALTSYTLEFEHRAQVSVARTPAPTSGSLRAEAYINGSFLGTAELSASVSWSGSKDQTTSRSVTVTSSSQPIVMGGTSYYRLGNLRLLTRVETNWFDSTATAISSLKIAVPGCSLPAPNVQISAPLSGIMPTSTDWTADYTVTPDSGLAVRNVKLGPRYFAQSVSLEYFDLALSNFSGRCYLKGNGTDSECKSTLVGLRVQPAPSTSSEAPVVIEAKYEITNIPRRSCNRLTITQTYEFHPVNPTVPCEPSVDLHGVGLLCGTFKPIVSYSFLPADVGSTLQSITTAQRLHYVSSAPHIFSPGLSSQATAVFKDEESGLRIPSIQYGNPTMEEVRFIAVDRGAAGQADNIHQTYFGAVDKPVIDLEPPNGRPFHVLPPGCPECVHTHWRWGSIAGERWGGGRPLIDAASKQSVEVAVVRYRTSEERAKDIAAVANGEKFEGPDSRVTWYLGTGYQNEDRFFTHGTFYSPCGIEQRDVQLVRGAPRRKSDLFEVPVTVQNTSGRTITGPISLVLQNLGALKPLDVVVPLPATRVTNGGTTSCVSPGAAFVKLSKSTILAPGERLAVVLEISSPEGPPRFGLALVGAGIP